jgi:hypothetical protein
MGDETRDLINNAELQRSKKHKDDPAGKALHDADAALGGAPPSTRQLLVDAEKLIGDRPKKGGGLWIAMAVAFVIGAVAVWYLMG